MTAQSSSVDVVMLTWNRLEMTRRAVESYRRWVRTPYRLICIDNGSTDGTVEYLRSVADLVVANSVNVGAVRARNQGWAVSGADFILSTDNDVEFTTDIVARLLAVMRHDPDVGIAGPLLNEHLAAEGLPTDVPLAVVSDLVARELAGQVTRAEYVTVLDVRCEGTPHGALCRYVVHPGPASS